MKKRITIIESNILQDWSIHVNGKMKHSGKNNPASLRYRNKCIDKLKKFYSEIYQEVEVVVINTQDVTVVRSV